MTHFKLYLLTPQFKDNVTVYIEDQITEFYSQLDQDQSRAVKTIDRDGHTIEEENFEYDDIQTQRENLWLNNHNTFAYSYNEKITKEQNAQKTLTFEMNRYISVANEWRENPFARNLMVGSIILLKEFRYREVSEEIFFTVSDIKYNFQENNTIYSVTCQDSFTYQSARQNEGYTIKNDPESSDFIGAKTIDWWIINKIMPECHMNYQYLSMQTGLYLTKEGHYYTFDVSNKDNIQIPENESILKIIKEPYSPEKDKDYFDKFSFSCSNSNANAALIALADLINFQLNSFEHARFNGAERLNVFDQFFWVEPKHNDQRLGLEYNPSQSIKKFGLTHKGESLTTVLNVVGPTINDEVITLVPSVPPFFADLFLSGQLWDNSSFNVGFFENICKGKMFLNYSHATEDAHANVFNIGLGTIVPTVPSGEDYSEYIIKNGSFYDDTTNTVCGWYDENTHFRYFPIYTEKTTTGILSNNFLFDTPALYNHISFTYEGNVSRIIKGSGDDALVFQNNGSVWELVLHDLDTDIIYAIRENVEANIFTFHKYRAFIRIRAASDVETGQTWNNPSIYLRFYRYPSEEELSFAKIADTCPWLENKLIDFSYFYSNRFITTSEYEALMEIMNNKLRIVNGKLLFYAQAYYNALHQETQILANIQNKLDMLGAECQASIIDPCANSVAPSLNLKSFKQTYLDIISNNQNNYTSILNHTTLLEEYFTKYFNTQQRFLKNVKAFRDFFDANVNFSAEGLYHYSLSIDLPNFIQLLTEKGLPSDGEEHTTEVSFYSFANAQFQPILSNFQYYIGYSSNGEDLEDLNNYGEPTVPVYKYISGEGYTRLGVVSKRNYKNYYLAKIKAGTRYQITSNPGDEDQLDGTYNNENTYYQIVFRVPIQRDSVNDDWYLEEDSLQAYKIGLTNSMDWNGDPSLTSWKGLYKIFKMFGSLQYLCCIGDHIELDRTDNTKGFLVLKPLPIIEKVRTDWQHDTLDSCEIGLCYLEKIDSWSITDYSGGRIQDITIKTDYQVITKTEAINNWLYYRLYNSLFNDPLYYHDTQMYHKLSSYTLDPEDVSLYNQWPQNNLAKGLITNFAKSSDAEISTPNEPWGESGYNLYLKYFPITNYYYYGPKYKVIAQDNEGVYYFKRLNAKGKDQQDYYNALANGDKIDNPYDYQEYQPITTVNIDNESDFYRRIHGNVAGAVWSGIATGLVSFAMWLVPVVGWIGASYSWLLYHMLWKYGPTWFAKEGLCNKTFFDEYCSDDNVYSGWHNWPEIVYALAENSYETYQKLTDAAIAANGNTSSIRITEWDDNYYKYIASDLNKNGTNLSLELYSEEHLSAPHLWGENKGTSENPIWRNEIAYPVIGNQIGITYNGAKAEDLYYKYTNGKLLTLNHRIRKDGKYKIIWWHNQDNNESNGESSEDFNDIIVNGNYETFVDRIGHDLAPTDERIFDLVEYYPIANAMIPLEVSNLDWESADYYSLQEALEACGYNVTIWGTSGYIFAVSLQGEEYSQIGIVSFVSIEDYISKELSDNVDEFLIKYPIKIYSTTNQVYTRDDIPVNFNTTDTLMNGYFYVTDKDSNFQRIGDMKNIPEYDKTEVYYDSSYQRAYTMYELINESPFITYYLQCQSYTEELLSGNITTFTPILVKNTALVRYSVDQEQINYSIDSFSSTEDKNIYTLEFGNSNVLNFDIGDINVNITLDKEKVSDIKGLTNGAFWYKYHTNLDHPLLLQQAAVIESQLTQYWQSAYSSSKYCEYFLPEHWQPVYDTKTNNFASTLFVIKYDDNGMLSMTVSNKMIPEVNVVRNAQNEIMLPRYQFKRIKKQVVYSPESGSGQYVDDPNHYSAANLSDNLAIVKAMQIVHENLENWEAEETGTQTYYYAEENTGMLWEQFIQESTKVSYDYYSGIYVMLYRILNEQYGELPMSEYAKYQKQHDHLWKTLHNRYQFMILENSYTNENATSSPELLQMAQYAFKSRVNPEAEYSIAVLNTSELKDYYGQEIRIGDGIKIDAQQYYNEYDQIYRSLSQYLFISKIDYSLRNPIDVSLTVNDVQYEDKIVQRLVKLIK